MSSVLSDPVFEALRACGESRVFENAIASKVMVVANLDAVKREPFVVEDKDMDAAGLAAAQAFSTWLKTQADGTLAWAKRIDESLARAKTRKAKP